MTLPKILNIVTVVGTRLGRWWLVRILTVSESGSIRCALRRRICLRNGIVLIARSNGTKLRTLTLVVTSSINKTHE